MFTDEYIKAKATIAKEVTNLVLKPAGMEVDCVFLIGSYAQGRATIMSDIDLLIQLKGERKFPTWKQIASVKEKIDSPRVHIIFGTERAQMLLHEKHKSELNCYAYRKIDV